jgi:MrcB-like, N-terminal domain
LPCGARRTAGSSPSRIARQTVVGWTTAYGFQYPERGHLANTEFSGGEHDAKARLDALGFDVVPRPTLAAADVLPLSEALEAALSAQARRVPGEWSDDLQKAAAVTLPNAVRAIVGDAYRVKGSAGAGNQAEIPWLSVMPGAYITAIE